MPFSRKRTESNVWPSRIMKLAHHVTSGLLLFLLLSTVFGQRDDVIQQPGNDEDAIQSPTCSLDEKALEERKNTLFKTLQTKSTKAEKKEGGYLFTLPRQEDHFQLVTSIILLESECCPFFSFHIAAAAGSGDLTFSITAPASAQSLLDEIFASNAELNVKTTSKPQP